MCKFGKRLKQLRENKQLSQNALAQIFHLSQSTIAYYELNKKQPNQRTLQQLADFFGVTTDYLLGRTDECMNANRKTSSENDKTNLTSASKFIKHLEVAESSTISDYSSYSITNEAMSLIKKTLHLDQYQQDAIKDILDIAHNIADKFELVNQLYAKAQSANRKVKGTKPYFIEILDLLDKPDTPLTIGGRILTLEERVQFLELLKEKVLADEEQTATMDNEKIVIAASYQGDSLVQNPSPDDIEDIKKAMEFVEQQEELKKGK